MKNELSISKMEGVANIAAQTFPAIYKRFGMIKSFGGCLCFFDDEKKLILKKEIGKPSIYDYKIIVKNVKRLYRLHESRQHILCYQSHSAEEKLRCGAICLQNSGFMAFCGMYDVVNEASCIVWGRSVGILSGSYYEEMATIFQYGSGALLEEIEKIVSSAKNQLVKTNTSRQ